MGPAEIVAQHFSVGFRGYSHEEVDAFLATVARQLDELDATVAAREARLARYRQTSGAVERSRLLRRLAEEAVATLEEADADAAQRRAELEEVRRQLRLGLQQVADGLAGAQSAVSDLMTRTTTEVVVDLREEKPEGLSPVDQPSEPEASPEAEAPPVATPRPVTGGPPAVPVPAAGSPAAGRGDSAMTVALAGLAALAWVGLFQTTGAMRRTASGLGQIGRLAPNDTGVPVLLAVWMLTTVAMMVPLVVPGLRPAHAGPPPPLRHRARVAAAFVAGYLAVWMAMGVVPPLALGWFRSLPGSSVWPPALAGALLVLAGFVRITTGQHRSAGAGPAPLAEMLAGASGWTAGAAFQEGLDHGVRTLARFGPVLVAVLAVAGFANLAWMAVLTVIFQVESRTGRPDISRAVGVALILLGLLMAAFPGALRALAGA